MPSPETSPDREKSSFLSRALAGPVTQTVAVLVVVASSAAAIGPDSWMEWLFWGTTVISHETQRLALGAVAVILAVAIAWPFLTRPRR